MSASNVFTVRANSDTLMRQAPMTAHDYLLAAVHDIDAVLGKGYAKDHPELVGHYIQTCALDFGAAVIARAIENAGTWCSTAIQDQDRVNQPEYPEQKSQ